MGTIYFQICPNSNVSSIPLNSPHSLEVEEGEGEDPNADPRDAPHLGQVPPDLEVLPHHDAAGVPHGGAADGQQDAVAGGEGRVRNKTQKYFL